MAERAVGMPTATGFEVLTEAELARLQAPLVTPPAPQVPDIPPLPAADPRPGALPPSVRGEAAGPTVETLPAQPVQDWHDLLMEQSARELGEAMIAAGRNQPAGGFVPHHIVLREGGGAQMAAARARLMELGIDLNQEANGVWLPSHRAEQGAEGAYHERLHNRPYFEGVADGLRVAGSRDDALAILRDIGQQLSEGVFSGVRLRTEANRSQP
ncbi:MAG: AHH domain-containing protein [Chitinophagaceae bacterium]|nr:AHH domain-containing protein [Rubrivivax sp.]